MGRIAAIDYGLKRIGLSLSDQGRKIALPVGLVEGGKKAIANIAGALPLKEVELILIGLPLLMNGKKGDMAVLVEKFGQDLQTAVNIPVLYWDERLSSKHADSMMREISLNRKQRSERIDVMTATLLLQSYLDSLLK
jgi:putative Holliday junction resolvase